MLDSQKNSNRYDKYKDSGIEWIGEIPDSWNMAKLSWCSQFINGYAFDSTQMDMDKKIPVVRIGDIQNGKVDYDNCLKVMQNDNLKSYIVKLKDIVIAMSGATTGKIATIDRTNLAYINQRVGIIRSQNNQFIKYCLENESFIKYIDLLSSGSAQPNISMGDILHFKIPYISIKEQEAIAGYLDRKCGAIDETIEKQKSVIEKLKEYKQSIITQAVTKGLDKSAPMKDSGIEWLGQIPQHWDSIKLKYKFRIKKDIAGEEGFDILSVTQQGLKIKDISTNEGQLAMDYSKYQIVKPSDFVMNHMDLLTGWVDCSAYFGVTSPDYRVFVNTDQKNCNNQYYNYVFQICYKNKIFYGLGQGVSGLGRWRLQSDKFLNFRIPIPPYNEQEQIVQYINKKCSEIDKTIEDKEKLIEKLLEYKKSLIYECVTGKRKVVA